MELLQSCTKPWKCVQCTQLLALFFSKELREDAPLLARKSLQWRHNGCDGVSNHQPHDCLLNRLFGRRSKKTSKLRVTVLCVGIHRGPVNSPHKWPVTQKMFTFVILMTSSCARSGMSFVSSKSEQSFRFISIVLCSIPWYIGLL